MDPKNDENFGSMIYSLISNLESFIQETFRQELGLNWMVYILLGWRGVSHFGRCFFIILHISSRTLLHFLHILHALLHFLHIRRCTHNHLSPLAKTDVAVFNSLCVLGCLLKVSNFCEIRFIGLFYSVWFGTFSLRELDHEPSSKLGLKWSLCNRLCSNLWRVVIICLDCKSTHNAMMICKSGE